jgi:predicted DNA-binding transcriptional regulator AlpA
MNDAWLTIADLADRWSVSKQTARQRTLEAGFPAELALTGRLLRWQASEVAVWEKRRQERPKRRNRRVRPFDGSTLPMPARVA